MMKRLAAFLLALLILLPGLSFAEETAGEWHFDEKGFLTKVTERTKKILTDNWAGLDKLAKLLIEKEVIMSDDIEAIFGPKAGKHGEDRLKEASENTENKDGDE